MTIVVDASVLIVALVDTSLEGIWAESVLEEEALIGPELALLEASNILRRLELAGSLTKPEVSNAHSALLQLNLELFPFAPFAARVWGLRDNLTCYDAWYVAIAEDMGCPVATLDRRLGRAIGPTCQFLTPSGTRLV